MNRAVKFLLLTIALLSMATIAFCDTADDFFNASLAKAANGDLDGAIADCTKAIELKPKYALAYNNRGTARKAKGDTDGAIADYTKAIELNPDYALPYYNRGSAKDDKGDVAGAIADYTKAIDLNSKFALPYGNRGCLRYYSRAFADAAADFHKWVELDSSNDYARFWVWLVRVRLGEAEAANAELQTYLTDRATGRPDDWASKVGRFLTGKLGEPEFLTAAKNADPKTEAGQLCEAYFYAGSKRLFAGDMAAAIDCFQKSIATDKKTFTEYRGAVAELKFLKQQKN